MLAMDLRAVLQDMAAAGLSDVQVLAAVKFADSQDFLVSLYPGKKVEVPAEVHEYIDKLLESAPARARLALQVELTHLSGGAVRRGVGGRRRPQAKPGAE